jgi:predicted TIM-barrel fold metal-dependent hydrolase
MHTMRITRRSAMQVTAAGLGLAAGVVAAEPEEAALPAGAVIDTHTHFYDPSRPQGVPWPAKDDRVLYRTVLPKHLKTVASEAGVKLAGTVVVEASPWLEDNQWLLDLAKDEPLIVGIVGHLSPGEKDFAGHLQRLARNPLYRGIRISHGDLRKGLSQQAYLDDLARLADADLALDVNGGPDMPADVARLAEKLPNLRIVINHAANQPIDGKSPPEKWLAGMQAAAAHERVWCKVSALVEATGRKLQDAPADVGFYRPVLDALWKAFGDDRLLFGSNWPVSARAASYRTLYDIVAKYVAVRGEAAAARYFARNSQAAYRWIQRT